MENRNEQEEYFQQVYNYAINLIVNEKKTNNETIAILISTGLDGETANIVVSNIQNRIKEERNEIANKNMLYGTLWCIGGLLVTGITYAVSINGGSYIFAWGAVFFGGLQFLKGLFQKLVSIYKKYH